MLDKVINLTDKLINFVMIIFFLFLLLIGGYAFFDSYALYDETKLDDEVLNLKPRSDDNFNFDALSKINEDVEAWITIFETSIDYPILHSKDNLDYLNTDYKKEYATGGSIFTDYRNKRDFTDDYSIVYGHNMSSGQMFADIKKYEDTDYFNQHLYGVLYTKSGVYKIEAVSLAKINAFEDDLYNLITYANGRNQELMRLVEVRSIKTRAVEDFSKLVLLSTCDSFGSNDRTVLLVRLSSSDESEINKLAEEAKLQAESNSLPVANALRSVPKSSYKAIGLIILLIVLIIVLVRKLYNRRRERKEKD